MAPHLSLSSSFFTLPSSLFFLPPLSLFTHFLHLHFLPRHTISSLENHSPKLLNLLSFISLNIFLDLCVLDHLCYKPIFWNPSPNLHFFFFFFLHWQWHLPMGLPFFLLMGKNITHPLNGMRKKGSSKTHAPHSKTDFKVSSFFGFFVGKFASFMFCWELDVETLSFCCCLLLLKLWTLYDLAGNSCDHVVILALGHFWIVELFGMVKFGQCWWLMKFVALMNEFWLEFCRHGSCENLMCRLDWTNSFLMSAGILLECVSPISWVWKFLWVWVWVWIWKIFCGVLDFYVGHGIFFFFFFLLDI